MGKRHVPWVLRLLLLLLLLVLILLRGDDDRDHDDNYCCQNAIWGYVSSCLAVDAILANISRRVAFLPWWC